jgi:uncharacterized protein (TIGR00269 family)
MNCSRCKRGGIVELPYVNQSLCKDCFVKFFEKRVRRTIRRYGLLEPEDMVAVALSGGKDSMTCLTILNDLSKKAPKSELFAIMIDEGSPGYRDKLIKNAAGYCEKIGVPYHIFSFKEELGYTIVEIMKRAKNLENAMPACSYCGVFRRQLLNQKARELGATKVVTGHNLDDECQTALMNFVRGDAYRIARAGAVVGAIKNEKFVSRIKPLRETPEAEVKLYTQIKHIPTAYGECPFNTEAYRVTMKKVILDLEKKYPGTRYQILGSVDELVPILRKHYTGGKGPNVCRNCGELSSGEECKFCLMRKELGF